MISVIIPALNEEAQLPRLMQTLLMAPLVKEVIVSDGGSKDETISVAQKAGALTTLSEQGRARQMNAGARVAKGKILYFLHADTLPPSGFDQEIVKATESGHKAGCFRLKFHHPGSYLKFYSLFTTLPFTCLRFGDQSLFVEGELFREAGGFNEKLHILEDQEMVRRLKQKSSFFIVPKMVTTSARRFAKYGIIQTQIKHLLVYLHYALGARPADNYRLYCQLFSSGRKHELSG